MNGRIIMNILKNGAKSREGEIESYDMFIAIQVAFYLQIFSYNKLTISNLA